MDGVKYPDMASATAARDKVATAQGYPRCARLTGTVIGYVPPCKCGKTGVGADVDPGCPYATRRETDVVVDATGAACLVVSAAQKSDAATLAVAPEIATAAPLTLPPVVLPDGTIVPAAVAVAEEETLP